MNKSYPHAVLSPFSKEAEGAQVPDHYSFPTSTQTLTTSCDIVSDDAGNFDFTCIPNLLHSFFCNNSDNSAGLSTEYAIPGVTSNSASMWGILSPTQLAAYENYRVVGVGWRFRSQLVPMTATGTLYMACFPTPETHPSNEWITDAVDRATLLHRLAIPQASPASNGVNYIDPIFQSYPTGHQLNVYEFNRSGIECSSRITGAAAYDFIPGRDIINNGATASGSVQIEGLPNRTVGGTPSSNLLGYYQSGGFSQWCVRGVGFPASSTVGILEFKFHVEYIDANEALYSTGTFPVVNNNQLVTTADTAAGMPFFRGIATNINLAIESRLGY